jgi:phosphoribosylanthranilate isomerase
VTVLERFLDPTAVSLKICGVTRPADAAELAQLGVEALGVNFWPGSKRYVAPEEAGWLRELEGRILRVGVFVNEPVALPLRLVQEGLLDVVQLHGDERPEDAAPLRDGGVTFFKAIGVKNLESLADAAAYGAAAVVLDAHAPGVYGGTGVVFDWEHANAFREAHPEIALILAGGIVPENSRLAAESVHPAALDVASGAESAPGVKDLNRVAAILTALGR